MEKNKKTNNTQKNEPRNKFVRLSGIGIQMGVTIFLCAWAGKWLDKQYPSDKNWFTLGLTLFGVAVALYNVLRQVNEANKNS